MLEILPGRFGGVEPVSHVGLVFGGGVFVAEYVGDLAFFTVVRAWDGPWAGLWGATRDAEGVTKKPVFVRDVAGGASEVYSQ